MNRNSTLPARATDFSEAGFWRALQRPAGMSVNSPLATAIRFGRAGNAEAYTALAEYHRQRLAGEWQHLRQPWQKQPVPDTDQLQALFDLNINVWHHLHIQFDQRIDWYPGGKYSVNHVSRDTVH